MLALVAIPIGGRLRRNPSVAAIIGLVRPSDSPIGPRSVWPISRPDRLRPYPPLVAAWAASIGVFLLVGTVLFCTATEAEPSASVLRPLAGLVPSVLLALYLLGSRVTKPAFFNGGRLSGLNSIAGPCVIPWRIAVACGQRCRHRYTLRNNVELPQRVRQLQRLVDDHHRSGAAEVVVDGAPIHGHLAAAGRKTNARDCRLPLPVAEYKPLGRPSLLPHFAGGGSC